MVVDLLQEVSEISIDLLNHVEHPDHGCTDPENNEHDAASRSELWLVELRHERHGEADEAHAAHDRQHDYAQGCKFQREEDLLCVDKHGKQ